MFRYSLFFCILCAVFLIVCVADEHRIIFPGDDRGRSNSSRLRDDPCAPYNPPTPDFFQPGRRISSVKCYEYVWQMKVRHERTLRKKKCESPKLSKYQEAVPQILGGRKTLGGEFPNMVSQRSFILAGVERSGELVPVLYVIGGYKVLEDEFPSMGAIGWKAISGGWVFMCGSSLISPKFVLTAAHCSYSRDSSLVDPDPKIVRLGERSILDSSFNNGYKPTDVEIIRIINHPNYKPPKQYFDISLMELGKEVKFTKSLQPVCLWNEPEVLKYGNRAQIAGWGVVKSGSRDISSDLLAANVDIIDTEQCSKLLMPNCNRNWCGLRDQICAGKLKGGVDSCQGDSGGPLQAKIPLPLDEEGSMHYLLGVTSFGIGCGLPNLPGVYTQVSSYIDWIEKIVWE